MYSPASGGSLKDMSTACPSRISVGPVARPSSNLSSALVLGKPAGFSVTSAMMCYFPSVAVVAFSELWARWDFSCSKGSLGAGSTSASVVSSASPSM
ncbi:Uncharacterised protein [Mycobacteroides abscessus subsp. massiliense]|nr:Uncharacterised protein [Mycobacteroides abscessus subsp. massiliense]SKO25732.1 Uncharacterised protein [Mycobacteroides abscessus subsp. massiliense]